MRSEQTAKPASRTSMSPRRIAAPCQGPIACSPPLPVAHESIAPGAESSLRLECTPSSGWWEEASSGDRKVGRARSGRNGSSAVEGEEIGAWAPGRPGRGGELRALRRELAAPALVVDEARHAEQDLSPPGVGALVPKERVIRRVASAEHVALLALGEGPRGDAVLEEVVRPERERLGVRATEEGVDVLRGAEEQIARDHLAARQRMEERELPRRGGAPAPRRRSAGRRPSRHA